MASFDIAIGLIFAKEGGFQSMPTDRGNYNSQGQLVGTNYGISAKTYETYLGRVVTLSDMKSLTRITAQAIYLKYYWNQYRIYEIENQSLANQILDLYVQHSPGAALNIIEKSINQVNPTVSGTWRQKVNTIAKTQSIELNNSIAANRLDYYGQLSGNFPGWFTRAKSFILENPAISFVGIGLVLFLVIKK